MKSSPPHNGRRLRPLGEEGSVAAPWMRHVAEFLEGRGLKADLLFARAGLSVSDTADADRRFPVRQVDLLWHLASVQAADPHIALRPGPARPPSAFDALAYAMMSCDTLGDAVERLIGYSAVVSDAVALTCERHAAGATIHVHPTEPEVAGRSLRLDYTLVTFLRFCNWLTGKEVRASAVELPYAAPPDASSHVAAFNLLPRFSRPHHALSLAAGDLAAPLPTANARLAHLHRLVISQRVREVGQDSFQKMLLASLVRRIAAGRVRRAEVASDLFMSDRTLQRRLKDHELSFKSASDEARKRMAREYLSDPAIPLVAVGELLGFAESSTLHRASRRWFGATPKEVRVQAQRRLLDDSSGRPSRG